MARFGQIPPYGKRGFRQVNLPYDQWERQNLIYSGRSRYELKADPAWFIRNTPDSHHWRIFHQFPGSVPVMFGQDHRTLTLAMDQLLAGIDQGFYPVYEQD